MKNPLKLLFIYIFTQILWFVPPPSPLSIAAWHLFALFLALIFGVLIRPFPMGATALIALTVAVGTRTLDIDQALGGFSDQIVWLIVLSMFIARGFMTTGLGRRLSYKILGLFGGNSLGIGYGLVIADLIFAPAVPSVTARVGGIIYPILHSIIQLYNRNIPDRKMSAFLHKLSFRDR